MANFNVLVSVFKTEYLRQTFESLRRQTVSNFEVVVIDDCSAENVLQICDEFPDLRLRYFRNEKNLGKKDPSRSWNKGLEFCTKDYVCLVGDDDCLDSNYFETMGKLVAAYPNAGLYRSRLRIIDTDDQVLVLGPGLPLEETWDEFLYQRNTHHRPHSTSEFCLPRQLLIDLGGWVSLPMAIGSDDLTYLNLAQKGKIVSTNDTWASWRRHRKQISTSRRFDSERNNALHMLGTIERKKVLETRAEVVPKNLLLVDLPGKKISGLGRTKSSIIKFLGQIGFE